ncbi:unnamed protein product [Gongylonema pulchrum]|uniref:Protein kinase domain-containing protein n=1 Tax=Gongylonema pulchrum TaxID=637853 RepID=A0A183EX61_9BILA|nr:unnamed protein product [Gongylonema pulchrum]
MSPVWYKRPERFTSQRYLRVVALSRTNVAIADFGTGAVEYIDWNVPKNPISALQGASESHHADEILLCHRICRFPYILGFGDDLIEVRLAINGNLLCSMYMPHVKVLSTKRD